MPQLRAALGGTMRDQLHDARASAACGGRLSFGSKIDEYRKDKITELGRKTVHGNGAAPITRRSNIAITMTTPRRKSALRTPDDWPALAKRLLKAELAKRDITYLQLTEFLGQLGMRESPENLASKINRGKFSAAFPYPMP